MVTTSYYFENCRDGFNHVGLLMNDGEIIKTAKVHYINRTWERYTGQTARKNVCQRFLDELRTKAVNIAKAELNATRATKAVKMRALEIQKGWPIYNEVSNHVETL